MDINTAGIAFIWYTIFCVVFFFEMSGKGKATIEMEWWRKLVCSAFWPVIVISELVAITIPSKVQNDVYFYSGQIKKIINDESKTISITTTDFCGSFERLEDVSFPQMMEKIREENKREDSYVQIDVLTKLT